MSSISKRQKLYLAPEKVQKIVDVFVQCNEADDRPCDEKIINALRAYVQAPKSMYENALLLGVLDGEYRIINENGRVGYAIWPPPKDVNVTPEEYEKLGVKADKLLRAMKQCSLYAKKDSGVLA